MKILVQNAGKAVVILLLLFPFTKVFGQNIPCPFNTETFQFQGSPKEQARCLLRPVKQRGILGEQLKRLPASLEKLIGEKIKIKKESLRKFLIKNNISETSIGGSL